MAAPFRASCNAADGPQLRFLGSIHRNSNCTVLLHGDIAHAATLAFGAGVAGGDQGLQVVADGGGIRTDEGWLYLSAILELYARKVVGWAMDQTKGAALITKSLDMALANRRPAQGLIHHPCSRSSAIMRPHGQAVPRQFE